MNYHNPEQLSDWGQSDGWRLLTTEEIDQPLPDDAEFCTIYDGWICSGQRGCVSESAVTYRTKKPIPAFPLIAQLDAEIKAKQELKEIALAVEAGAEWEFFEGEWISGNGRILVNYIHSCKVRLRPKPVTRPWSRPEDVPLVTCRLRWRNGPEPESWATILSTCNAGVTTACSSSDGEPVMNFTAWEDLKDHEYSTGGEWKPCETTEEAK